MTVKITERREALPLWMGAGQEIEAKLDGEDVVVIGASNNAPVIMTPAQWATLKRWKLTRLTYSGEVRAGDGTTYHTPAARFLAGIQYENSKHILYVNGNALDLRPSNLRVLPRSTTKII
jgi:hypothetical protein